jgi:sec-independent protein translocase protein TatB
MFDPSFSELVLVFVIGLLILGPKRLPKVASQIGRWVGRARRTAAQLRHQLEREIALSEIADNQKRRAAAATDTQAPKAKADAAMPDTQAPKPEADAAVSAASARDPVGTSDEKSKEPSIPG